MIRRALLSGSPLMGAAVIAKGEKLPQTKDAKGIVGIVCKPSQLSIYNSSFVDR